MKRRKRLVTLMVAAICALAGTAAGISQSSAAKNATARSSSTQAMPSGEPGGGRPGGNHGPGGPGGEVHAVEVVLNKAGTAFVSETTDNGTIKEVDSSGGSITITEGTKTLTYGTPTITIPSGATVTLDGKTSTLSELKSGDQVRVSSSSDGTTVFATDSSFKPSDMGGGPGHGMGGPPPGASAPSGSSSSSTE
jgi:hypothetical protein